MTSTLKTCLRILSFMLISLGTLADALAGAIILNHEIIVGVIVHLMAIFLWISGLAMLEGPPSIIKSSSGVSMDWLHRQTFLAALMGLLLFPGIGPLGWTLAAGIASFMRKQKPPAKEDEEHFDPNLSSQIGEVIKSPKPDVTIQPLVEIPYAADIRLKRAALDLICREPSPKGISLVRNFLADQDADVRALAAVAMSRLETHFSELLGPLEKRIELEPKNAKHYAAAGHLYHEYALEGNSASRLFYLVQARKNLEQAVSLEPLNCDALLDLAEILLDLGDPRKALDTVTSLLSARPELSKGYLLGMEIALREHNFGTLLALAEQASMVLPEDSDVIPLMKWWLAAKIPDESGVQ